MSKYHFEEGMASDYRVDHTKTLNAIANEIAEANRLKRIELQILAASVLNQKAEGIDANSEVWSQLDVWAHGQDLEEAAH